ncbi:MAG: carbohydrate ABC transporter permease [Bacilli bacterium]|jgi:multiple sugar transport system permease protein|nr:carbohydrate ABC transporter permease [Acholeplasmataceae bacterium]HOA78445.1 carbohydrate ABC transporter permease [Bacilli bacterium]HPZ26931.1 carbohydrate ABC transporter permease [Bacilli bacterium]HQC89354.1 carbohydrate ABC transporter permease [Bacilli bacterium]
MTNKEKKTTFIEKLKEEYRRVKGEWKNPTLIKVRKRKALIYSGAFVRTIILIGLVFIILLPIFEKFSFALRDPMNITDPQVVFIPKKLSTLNFQIAIELLDFRSSLVNTVVLSTFTTLIQVMASAIAGYAFARLRFRGSDIIFYIVLFTLVVPNETLHIARFLMFTHSRFLGLKLMGNIFSMYIMAAFGMGIRSAIFIYLFRQFFRGLPVELEESAEIDGAGVFRTFWSVMLPNARGAIVVVGLFAFVWQWNDYYYASLFQYADNNFPVLSTKLASGTERLFTILSGWVSEGKEYFKHITDEQVKEDPLFRGLIANTAALLMMIPLLVGYLFVQRRFVESIERTGIVG